MTDSAGNKNKLKKQTLKEWGVIVRSDLKWREHVGRMSGKAKKTRYA